MSEKYVKNQRCACESVDKDDDWYKGFENRIRILRMGKPNNSWDLLNMHA